MYVLHAFQQKENMKFIPTNDVKRKYFRHVALLFLVVIVDRRKPVRFGEGTRIVESISNILTYIHQTHVHILICPGPPVANSHPFAHYTAVMNPAYVKNAIHSLYNTPLPTSIINIAIHES